MTRKGLKLLLLLFGCCLVAEAQQESVFFSHSGGFYEHSFELSLGCPSLQHHVRYTTNGDCPTASSFLYESPLRLDERLYSTSDIFSIPVSPVFPNQVYPDSVRHAIVIRAAVFDENEECVSKVVTNTYLIRDLGCNAHGLAVVSVCADSLSLFDNDTGILVPGARFNPDYPDWTGNYFERGREWERLANVEFYEPYNTGINQQCGLRTHGNRARKAAAKGLKIYAREEYGKKRFKHRFFETTSISSFKRLILKPFSTLWPCVGVQDYVADRMALQLGLDAPHSRPVVLYLNGEYWGIYFLQEKLDDHYLEDHYDIEPEECNIISNWGKEIEAGDPNSFEEMMAWLEYADLSDDQNYQRLCGLIDVDNFIDYQILETFIANTDWPANNNRCWQQKDGLWRWAFFDGDAALMDTTYDVFANATYLKDDHWHTGSKSTLLFRRLLENNSFKHNFKNRVNELCDSDLRYENTRLFLDEVVETLYPEMRNHMDRFNYPSTIDYWNWGVFLVRDFMRNRVKFYLDAYEQFEPFKDHEYVSNTDDFACYPNPIQDVVNIKMLDGRSRAVAFDLLDITGVSYMRGTIYIPACEVITLHLDLPPGVYAIKIGARTHRIVKL